MAQLSKRFETELLSSYPQFNEGANYALNELAPIVACEFLEWTHNNNYKYSGKHTWFKTDKGGTPHKKLILFTAKELFEEYENSNPST